MELWSKNLGTHPNISIPRNKYWRAGKKCPRKIGFARDIRTSGRQAVLKRARQIDEWIRGPRRQHICFSGQSLNLIVVSDQKPTSEHAHTKRSIFARFFGGTQLYFLVFAGGPRRSRKEKKRGIFSFLDFYELVAPNASAATCECAGLKYGSISIRILMKMRRATGKTPRRMV